MTDTTRPDGVLAAYAEGRIHHLNRGLCPDEVAGHSSRDPDCPVCAALSHAKPAEGGVVDEQKAFEKEFGRADQQRLDSDGVARHSWARKGWMARAALARKGGASDARRHLPSAFLRGVSWDASIRFRPSYI